MLLRVGRVRADRDPRLLLHFSRSSCCFLGVPVLSSWQRSAPSPRPQWPTPSRCASTNAATWPTSAWAGPPLRAAICRSAISGRHRRRRWSWCWVRSWFASPISSRSRTSTSSWPSLLFVSIILLFGAVGEEMLFRGYGFQVLVKAIGPFATILPMAVLFGLAHSLQSEFHLARAVQHHPVGSGAGLRVHPQRRSVAAHRPAFRLELGPAAVRRQPQRVYNGSYRVLDALEDWRTLEWRRLWPGRRPAHERGGCWRCSSILQRPRSSTRKHSCCGRTS